MYDQKTKPDDVSCAILAGGMGKRLHSIVSDRPKVLAKILGRPFITFLFDQLESAGLKNVILCTGYMGDYLPAELGDEYGALKLTYSLETTPMDTGGALRLSLPFISGEYVLVMNGDSYVNIDLTEYLDWFFKMDRQASLLLVNVSDTRRYGSAIVDPSESILKFKEKETSLGPGWINGGIYIIKKDLIRTMPEGEPFSLERQFFPNLIGKGLFGFKTNFEFIDIGTPESFVQADSLMANFDKTKKNFT